MTLHWFLEDDKDEEVAYHAKHVEDQQCNEEELCSPAPLLQPHEREPVVDCWEGCSNHGMWESQTTSPRQENRESN